MMARSNNTREVVSSSYRAEIEVIRTDVWDDVSGTYDKVGRTSVTVPLTQMTVRADTLEDLQAKITAHVGLVDDVKGDI